MMKKRPRSQARHKRHSLPVSYGLKMKTETIIRKAVPEEAPLLSDLAFRSKAYWGYDDAFMTACREELTLSTAKVLEHPTYVLETGGEIVGFYNLEHISGEVVELGYLFVEPREIGNGYGSALVQHARETAKRLGYQSITIQGDPNARGFYEAWGARLVGSRPSASIAGRELPLFRLWL